MYIIYFSIFHLKNKHNSIKKGTNKYIIPGVRIRWHRLIYKKDYAFLLINLSFNINADRKQIKTL